jgi:phospholipid/cholesterol/gamma-HCH transport system substrate-binding protein
MNKYLTDDKLGSNVRASIANLNELTQILNVILTENRNDIKALTTNAVELTKKSNELISDNKENINDILANLKTVFQKSDTLLTDLNSLTRQTMNKENNVGKLLYDENVIKDLKQTLKQVNDLTSLLLKQLTEDGINVNAHIF